MRWFVVAMGPEPQSYLHGWAVSHCIQKLTPKNKSTFRQLKATDVKDCFLGGLQGKFGDLGCSSLGYNFVQGLAETHAGAQLLGYNFVQGLVETHRWSWNTDSTKV